MPAVSPAGGVIASAHGLGLGSPLVDPPIDHGLMNRLQGRRRLIRVTVPDPPPDVAPRWSRLLLPASLLDESQLTEGDARTPPRSLRDWFVDLTMLIAAVGIGALAF